MRNRLLGRLPAAILVAIAAIPVARADTRLLDEPDIHGDRIVFTYAGDLYSADRSGGDVRRLTVMEGEESSPAFSPDGRFIAFTGTAGGNRDVYVIPSEGGQPRRLTWHPDPDIVRGWTPDGQAILFTSPRHLSYQRGGQLFTVSLASGLPVALPMPIAFDGAYAPDGRRIAYQPFPSGYSGRSGWRRYRGGTTPPIWLFDFASHEITRIPDAGVNDRHPMWLGDRVYFVSDRDDVFNLWSYEPRSGALEELTHHRDWDITAAAGSGDAIVYAAGGRLHLYDLASGEDRQLAITIHTDLPEARVRWIDGADFISEADLAPDGGRVVFTSRGEIVTVPARGKGFRNLTTRSGANDRSPLWSPDGRTIAYLSDASGEYELVLAPADGLGPERRITLAGSPAYYRLDAFTPDGKSLLYEDNHLNLYALALKSGTSRRIDRHLRRWFPRDFELAISPDSHWLAYTRVGANYLRELFLYNFATGSRIAVGDGLAGMATPAFSRDGQYLYFSASTNLGPANAWLDMSNRERPVRAGLYSVVLAASGTTPLPLDEGDPADSGKRDKDEDKAPPATLVDAEGLNDRIVALPVTERQYSRLFVGADGALYYLAEHPEGVEKAPPGSEREAVDRLWRFDPEKRKESVYADGVADAVMSADGSTLLLALAGDKWGLLATGEGVPEAPRRLNLSPLRLRIDPRAEWRQIFAEAWRIERDFFYDPGMHGTDWAAIRRKYEPLLDHVGTRADLNRILVWLVAELESGHARAFGGDIPEGPGEKVGLLGADFAIDGGHYRIARIYSGELWNPFLGAPLAVPGLDVREGDYLLEIDGRPLAAGDNIHAFLEGTLGRRVVLTLSHRKDGRNPFSIEVEPIRSDDGLRRWAWIEANRRRVAELSGGRVGYVYLPNTADAGFTYFNRLFFAQVDKQAMIIDERGNGGGQAADYIVGVLTRPYLASWTDRDGMMFTTPVGAVFGPKAMLIDQFAGSGGDFLPYAFRLRGGGPLIGKRTWGGLIGIGVAPPLIDGGHVTAPYFRFIDAEGHYSIENEGVSPDIEVEMTPKEVIAGRDPQLETAVRTVLEALAAQPSRLPASPPPYPEKVKE
ncbi:MAG: PDZ domain-containing protein [Rhodothalassiaceae bacterium]